MDRLVVGEFVRQGAEQRQDRDEAPVETELQVEDVDLQHVAGLRAAHMDRPGHEMRAGAGRQRVEGGGEIGGNAGGIGMQRLTPARRVRVQGHGIAGLHREHRGEGGVEVAEHHRLGQGGNLVMTGHGSLLSGPGWRADGALGGIRTRSFAIIAPDRPPMPRRMAEPWQIHG